jgi:hypothetical protein
MCCLLILMQPVDMMSLDARMASALQQTLYVMVMTLVGTSVMRLLQCAQFQPQVRANHAWASSGLTMAYSMTINYDACSIIILFMGV